MKKRISMKEPLVSIITPAFNSQKFISETIQSVIDQTYQNWEMIIVDDGSTDDTVAIARSFAENDQRIQLYTSDKNKGTGIARSRALERCNGTFISFLDADDLWQPKKLQKQIDFLLEKQLPFTFSFYDCINERGDLLHRRVEAPKTLTYSQLFLCNYVGNLTGIYSVSYFGKIAINKSRKRQDWILWLTILKQIKKAEPVTESLAFYRVRDNSISASKVKLLKYNFGVYRNFHEYNFLKASLCMIGFLFTQLVIKPKYVKNMA